MVHRLKEYFTHSPLDTIVLAVKRTAVAGLATFVLSGCKTEEMTPAPHRETPLIPEKEAEKKEDSTYQVLNLLFTEALEEEIKGREEKEVRCYFYQGESTRLSESLDRLFRFDRERLTQEIISGNYGDAGVRCFLGKVNPAYLDAHQLYDHIDLNDAQLWKMYDTIKSNSLKLSLLLYYIPPGYRVRKELPKIYPTADAKEAETLLSYLAHIVNEEWSGKNRSLSERKFCYGDCPHDENYTLFRNLYEVAKTKEQKCVVVMRLNALWNENEEEREKWCGKKNYR